MYLPKGKFVVGIKEKHDVSFETDFWSGGFSVYVDTAPTSINRKNLVSGPFSIEVGNNEKHTVTFQIIFTALFAAFRHKEVQILVDGKLFKTF